MPRATSSAKKSARAAKGAPTDKAAAAKKSATKKATKKTSSTAKKAPAKKGSASPKSGGAEKAAPKKAAAKKAPGAAKKAPAKAAPAKKAAAKKAPAKKAKSTKPSRTRVTKAARKAPVKLDAFQTKRREDLLAERSTYERQADSLQAEADQLAAEREPGDVQFDEESGEGDTLAVERERDLALSAQARAAIEEIDAALERLADGTYGTCERCGKAIPKARLEALPHAALCIDCKAGGLGRF